VSPWFSLLNENLIKIEGSTKASDLALEQTPHHQSATEPVL
jgi:hypothetical protein